jgi:hypothetical protein
MGRYASETRNFQQPPTGTFVARCYRIVDIGTQHGQWQGKETIRNQIIVFWELPTETYEVDGQQRPFTVSKFYTNSLNEKAALRQDLETWRGREFTQEELLRFDLEQILGAPCMLTLVKTESGTVKVSAVTKLPKGIDCPPAINPPSAFWIDSYTDKQFEELSDGLKKLVMNSDEYKKRAYLEEEETPEPTTDLPF